MIKRAFITFVIFGVLVWTSSSYAARKALLIGIADYENLPPPLRGLLESDLKGPVNDVERIKNALVSFYGFSEHGDIRVLRNEEATKHAIEASFHNWLVDSTTEGDLVVLYFAGFGSQLPEDIRPFDEDDERDEVLLPYDMLVDRENRIIFDDEFTILDDELGEWLDKLNGRTVVVIIDSCYSGGTLRDEVTRSVRGETVSTLEDTPAWRGRFLSMTDYTPPATVRAISQGGDIPEGVIFMAASGENELAPEVHLPQGFHGGFSFGLSEGMESLHTPSYVALFEYARSVVQDRLGLRQEPQLKGHLIDEPAFGGKMLASNRDHSPPVAPPEVIGERVLVAVDELERCTTEEMKRLKEDLARESLVELVEPDAFFDRLIRGEKRSGEYHIRLLNRAGDADRMKPAATPHEVVDQLGDHFEYAYLTKHLARLHHPGPPFTIEARVIDKITREPSRDFRIGDKVVFGVESEQDCYIFLIDLSSQGDLCFLFPNRHHDGNFITGHTPVLIPDERMGSEDFELEIDLAGEEMVKVIATAEPLNFRELGLWELREDSLTSEKIQAIQELIDTLSSSGIDWSEDTITIRSYEKL